jgi:hypothetical protein
VALLSLTPVLLWLIQQVGMSEGLRKARRNLAVVAGESVAMLETKLDLILIGTDPTPMSKQNALGLLGGRSLVAHGSLMTICRTIKITPIVDRAVHR